MPLKHDTVLGLVNMTDEQVAEELQYMPPLPTERDVKTECRRRILSIMTEDQQRNSLAAMTLNGTDYDRSKWSEIARLRERSNEIEQMNPIPDLSDDEVWK